MYRVIRRVFRAESSRCILAKRRWRASLAARTGQAPTVSASRVHIAIMRPSTENEVKSMRIMMGRLQEKFSEESWKIYSMLLARAKNHEPALHFSLSSRV